MTKALPPIEAEMLLPARFSAWFAARGWQPRRHQLDLLAAARAGEDALLIAPTGAGKTLAGFLPSLVELTEQPRNRRGLHTLYISPLKALAVDVERNLGRPVADLRLGVTIETRTGDTSVAKRKRQRERPPDILLTTPEQVALLLASPDSFTLFADLRRVVFDELHAIVAGKRGDLLALDLARLRTDRADDAGDGPVGHRARPRRAAALAGRAGAAALPSPARGRRWPREAGSDEGTAGRGTGGIARNVIAPQGASRPIPGAIERGHPWHPTRLRRPPSSREREKDERGDTEARPPRHSPRPARKADLSILDTEQRMPWSGHSARHALAEVYAAIRAARHDAGLRQHAQPGRIHLPDAVGDERGQPPHRAPPRLARRLAAPPRRGGDGGRASLKAVVCTSTLDLGIDWGDVDLVINVGAPKGSSRLMQRIGRANHRLDEPSRALLVPSNRFEVLECRAAVDAAAIGAQDTAVARAGALDAMCQHILGMACAGPFAAEELFAEITSAEPYRYVDRPDLRQGAGLRRARRLRARRLRALRQDQGGGRQGTARCAGAIANGRVAQAYRMNVGTIVEASSLKVRLVRGKKPGGQGDASRGTSEVYTGPLRRGGRVLGELEEGFLETSAARRHLPVRRRGAGLQAIVENEALVSRARSDTPRVPSYAGGKFPLSTYLAQGVRRLLADPDHWGDMPMQVAEWLELQRERSALPPPGDLLVETFPRGGRFYLVCYPFEGRLAHQTLGMLLTRRMERAHLRPLGFVATDYVMAVWGKTDIGLRLRQGLASLDDLFSQDMLGDDLEDWLQESALMKRTFRQNAIVSGLIERNFPGKEKSGRQITMSTDLIYDVLRRHEPDHILLQAARQDASTGLLDLVRLAAMLARIKGRILHKDLDKISPLAVPIMLEVGREPIHGEGRDAILAEAEAELVREVMG